MAVSVPTSIRPAGVCPATPSLVALLIALAEDYPDLDGHTVAQAVEQASASAEVLNPGLQIAPHQVEVLARDRLDAAAARVGRALPRDAEESAHRASRVCPAGCGPNPVACLYCRAPIAPEIFAYRSLAQRLVCATCPSCGELVTLRATTWRRLTARAWAPRA